MTTFKSKCIRRSLLAILALCTLAGYSAQATDAGRNYDIIATDGDFQPAVLTAQPGERVHITVHNQGRMYHSIVFVLPQGYVGIRGLIATWRSSNLTFEAPTVPGKYVFYCPIFNHGMLGMQGLLIVAKQ